MSDHRGRKHVSSDPSRPAYDNPTGNKGGLAAGNNRSRTREADGRSRTGPMKKSARSRPVAHASDGKLGQKPPPG
jgi:hypothetical protein